MQSKRKTNQKLNYLGKTIFVILAQIVANKAANRKVRDIPRNVPKCRQNYLYALKFIAAIFVNTSGGLVCTISRTGS